MKLCNKVNKIHFMTFINKFQTAFMLLSLLAFLSSCDWLDTRAVDTLKSGDFYQEQDKIFTIPYRTITIDGDSNDWTGIEPAIEDPSGDGIFDSLDITRLFLARDSQYLYILLTRIDNNFPSEASYVNYDVNFGPRFDDQSSEFHVYANTDSSLNFFANVYNSDLDQTFTLSSYNLDTMDVEISVPLNNIDPAEDYYLHFNTSYVSLSDLNTNIDADYADSEVIVSFGDISDVDKNMPIISGDITLNDGGTLGQGIYTGTVTIESGATVKMTGYVVIQNSLQIFEGATIEATTSSTLLIINRYAYIDAYGSSSNPITFTSDKASKARGDWGGIIINGNAPVNANAVNPYPDIPQIASITENYGGSDDFDSSGSLQYVRIFFAGGFNSSDLNGESNGLSLNGVGSGTSIEYIQVHNGLDDGIEIWGGTVNLRYVVSTGNGDDNFDADAGWNGNVQYLVSAVIDGKSAIEIDNGTDEFATPYTTANLANVTAVNSDTNINDSLIRVRTGATVNFYNSYAHHNGNTLAYDQCLVAASNGYIGINSSWMQQCGANGFTEDGANVIFDGNSVNENAAPGYMNDATAYQTFFNLFSNGENAFNTVSTTSPAISIDATTLGISFFTDPGTEFGALQIIGSSDWLSGWTDFPEN